MQAASTSYLPPHPQHFYQNIYHVQSLGPQDYEIKRQYLALLPPQQVIDICLTYDIHVPPYIRSSIWPADMTAAIASLQKNTATTPQTPVVASTSTEPATPTPAVASTSTAPAASPPPAQPPAHPPIQQQIPYPHQPYGYPPAAYPHAPYYPPPPGYPSYPPSAYPHYPPVPNGYAHPPPPQPGYSLPPNPYSAPQPPPHQDQGPDDLPSYEEMIVDALQESTDPEGCAPKDLFTWMASRYPLQSNFRPSASQALQKAFKRGRLEKSGNGKYRLSATWEGGNTSRRTTRRPQTQSQSQSGALAPAPSASPFTHAPLVHHSNPAQPKAQTQPYPGHPYPYPYGGAVPPGYAGYPPQPLAQHPASPEISRPAGNTADKTIPVSDADKDAYEAAQTILKAINFGDLLQIAQDEENGKKSGDVTVDQLTSLLVQAQSGFFQGVASQSTTVPPQPLPVVAHPVPAAVSSSTTEGSSNGRAELQAQLVLLAAQLTDLGHENGDSTLQSMVQPAPTFQMQEMEQQPSANSTVVDTPPMDSLLPPEETPISQAPTNPPVSPTTQQERDDSIPIDPVLQNISVISEPQPAQPKEATPPLPTPTAPPVVFPAVVALPPPPPNFVEGEDDSDDGDMEEII